MHWPCHYDGNSNNIMSYLFTLVTAWQPYGSDTNVNMHLHCKQRNKTTILVITSICHISYNGDTHITVHQQSRGCHHGDGTVCHGIWHTTLRAKTLYATGKSIVCYWRKHSMPRAETSDDKSRSVGMQRRMLAPRSLHGAARMTSGTVIRPRGADKGHACVTTRVQLIDCHARHGQRGRRVCCASVPHTWHA